MITTLDRIENERLFHDLQAAERARSFRDGRASLRFDDDEYLDHESWIRFAFDQLGEVRGKSVLDLGCGHGMAAVVLARRGANVTAIDLSTGYVNEARQRAAANRVTIKTLTADAESLPFPGNSFDAVWGNAILHHLHLPSMAHGLHRLMKPGGIAVFCEPWGGNLLLRFARRWLTYPGKQRTPDERPLEPRDLIAIRVAFPSLEVRGFQFFGMLRRLHPRLRCLDTFDRQLPFLERYGRYVVLTLRKTNPIDRIVHSPCDP